MRKIIKILLVLLVVFTLSSCSPTVDEQVTLNVPSEYDQQTEYYWSGYRYSDGTYYYDDILQYSNSSLSFEFFLTARNWSSYYGEEEENDYSYTFNITVSKPTSLIFSCNEDIFNIDFDPSSTLTYIRSIPLDAFLETCGNTSEVNIQIIEEGSTVFEDSFMYEFNNGIDVETLSPFTLSAYDYTNFLYIFLIGVTLLFGLVMGYRLYYNYRINKNFLDQDKKTFYLADIWVVFVLSTVVIVVLIFSTIFISRERYQNTHYSQVYSTVIDHMPLDISVDSYSILQLDVFVNNVDEITYLMDYNTPINTFTYSDFNESISEGLDSIVDVLNDYQVCNVEQYYNCQDHVDKDSFAFTIREGTEYYVVHFIINYTNDAVERIVLTDMNDRVYISIYADQLYEDCNSIIDEINELLNK